MTYYVLTDRITLLSCLPRESVCAEVGVFAGDFAEQILEKAEPRELHLVDAWAFVQYDQDALPRHVPKSQHEAFVRYLRNAAPDWTTEDPNDGLQLLYDKVQKRFEGRDGVHIHRGRSDEVLCKLPKSTFDFVYIDADHDYHPVLSDLWAAAELVRDGGLIMGHDFDMDRDRKWSNHGVIEAVMNFCKQSEYTPLCLSADLGSTYFLAKPPLTGTARRFFESIFSLNVHLIQLPPEILWNYRRVPVRNLDNRIRLIPSFRA